MLAKKISKSKNALATLAIAAFLAHGCATKSDVQDADKAKSDALTLAENTAAPAGGDALLATSSAPEQKESDIFSDLNKKEAAQPAAASLSSSPEPSAEPAALISDSSGAYYDAVGGESIGRVAVALYSSKKFASKLMEANSSLVKGKKLKKGDRVNFDLASVNPQPTYLTKGLLSRYPNELATALTDNYTKKHLAKKDVTVNEGDTLQSISEKLYGDRRYWAEIFLVNHTQISNYDKISPGLNLAVYDHPMVAKMAKSTPASGSMYESLDEAPKKPAKKSKAEKVMAKKKEPQLTSIKPEPVKQKLAPLNKPEKLGNMNETLDSQPPAKLTSQPIKPMKPLEVTQKGAGSKLGSLPALDTNNNKDILPMNPVVQPAVTNPVAVIPPPVRELPRETVKIEPSVNNNSNLPVPVPKYTAKADPDAVVPASDSSKYRRAIYVGMIVVIAGLAFFLTRPKKRPKIDLGQDGDTQIGRPKLAPEAPPAQEEVG